MTDAAIMTTTTQLAPPPKPKKDVDETPIDGMNGIVVEVLDTLGRVLALPPKDPNPFLLFMGLN